MRSIKRLAFVFGAVALLSLSAFAADEFNIDPSHSQVGFSVKHMMVTNVPGRFTEFSGKIVFDEKDPSKSSVNATIKAASINTDNTRRDEHLRSADFFDAEKHPQITFRSTSMKPSGKGKTSYSLEGDLTMHGVTKRVQLLAIGAAQTIKDPWGNTKYGFRVTGKVNRKDFGLAWNAVLEAGGVAVSEEVDLALSIELNKA